MSSRLEEHIKAQGYNNSINISLSEEKTTLAIYSPHWINHLRFNNAVWWICVIFGLWIITWPGIHFMEKRYQVVRVKWDTSWDMGGNNRADVVYAQDRDEAELADFWAPVVKQAVWARQRGETLTRRDVEQLEGSRWDEL